MSGNTVFTYLRGAGLGFESGTKIYIAKYFTVNVVNNENRITFASTVHTTLPIRTASQGVSFAFSTF